MLQKSCGLENVISNVPLNMWDWKWYRICFRSLVGFEMVQPMLQKSCVLENVISNVPLNMWDLKWYRVCFRSPVGSLKIPCRITVPGASRLLIWY